jgi:hypothetical protein
MIGKPYSGKLNVRFDEGELEIGPSPLRQLSTLPIFPFPKEQKIFSAFLGTFRKFLFILYCRRGEIS